ncbi:chromosome-partitioning protein Spo0J [Ferrovum sp. JA12]|uniref:ParB/RepB/Spo0J family partition protein n=1 Tax=Ferrovum sp. JA12 TaxID=1356299 RepID=UPI0007032D45|nr:ParB/RepB/Spo0J family partition protein [Ferrovum sp. JA12]KRH78241.1 chromosome-partitioning protein Spo0J [Ferrovum sp. JA12]
MSHLSLPQEIPIQWIHPDPLQPRKLFNTDTIHELSHNIKQLGLLQPLLVKQNSLQHFTLLCGERRLIAAKNAGLEKVPIIVRDDPHSQSLTRLMQYSENVFREELTAIESIDIIIQLIQDGISTQQLSEVLGKRHDWVKAHLLANTAPYRSLFESGRLKSISVLLVFRSLPLPAQRQLLTDTCPITSTLCQKIRQRYKESDPQRELPILNTITTSHRESLVTPVPRSTITIPLNPLWLRGFVTKKALIQAIEKIINEQLTKDIKQA